jgi:hypothetical protein
MAAPNDFVRMDDIPPDFVGLPLGPVAEVLRQLKARFPDVDLSDPSWGHLVRDGWSIDLNIGQDDPVDSIMLHVRGGGDGVLPVIAAIADAVNGRALDFSDGVFLTGRPDQPNGWRGFQAYRDGIFGAGKA